MCCYSCFSDYTCKSQTFLEQFDRETCYCQTKVGNGVQGLSCFRRFLHELADVTMFSTFGEYQRMKKLKMLQKIRMINLLIADINRAPLFTVFVCQFICSINVVLANILPMFKVFTFLQMILCKSDVT
ncbi:hypothetical protein Lal_00033209 [Lupinus albus]|nr:hypothetical protein Lal_00033209 [Lupinus albus]